jgi:FkbM family methyltransferase
VTTIYDKVNVVVDSSDGFVSRDILASGAWEPWKLRNMARFVKPGSRILNAGAHIGLEAVTMGRIAGSTGELYIFEPVRLTYSLLLRNIYLNSLGNIARVYNLGCHSKESTGVIVTPLSNTGMSIVYANDKVVKTPPIGKDEVQETIEMDRMDAVLPPDTVLDFALIDVERMEVECMDGLR